MEVLAPNYHCSQQQLYAVANAGWRNYQDHLEYFSAHKGRYTSAFGENAKLAIVAASNLPDDHARGSVPEALRIALAGAGNLCLENWQTLKSYITDAFPAALQKPMLQAAGSNYYKQAANQNWMQMQGMLNSAFNFMDEHGSELSMDGDNMPETFPAKFGTDKTAFETKYAAFLAAEQNSAGGTSNKLVANNAINETLGKMFADGQLIFRNDPVKKALFVFDTLLGYITTPGTTGLRIAAKDKVTQLPVAGFVVKAQPGNVQGTTDEDGVLELHLSENTYSLTGIKEGYVDYSEEDVKTTTGTMGRKNIELRHPE